MCKVFMLPGIKKENAAKAKELLKAATTKMTLTDSDGVGYAAITSTGEIFGEKWLKPSDAWNINENPEPPKPSKAKLFLKNNFGEALKDLKIEETVENVYDSFGKQKDDVVAVILHARKQTQGSVRIENTHPFAIINDEHQHDTAIIHNGEIKNHEKLTKRQSTCDSETILHEYLGLAVGYAPENIQNVAETLKGTYAVGVLTSFMDEDKGTNVPILDIFKSNKNLYCGYIEEFNTPVFATTKDILETACKEVNLTLADVFEVKDGILIRIDAITGNRLEDYVNFKLSDQYDSCSHGSNRRSTTSSNNGTGVSSSSSTNIPASNFNAKTNSVKEEFEQNNPDLFDHYIEVADLSQNEKDLLQRLNDEENPEVRAMVLVQKALQRQA